jgi:hypothetical protein
MKEPEKHIFVKLPESEYLEFKAILKRKGHSVSWFIRKIISNFISKNKDNK